MVDTVPTVRSSGAVSDSPQSTGRPAASTSRDPLARPRRPRRNPFTIITESRVLFVLTGGLYTGLAVHQSLVSQVYWNDAFVRLSNAQNVLTSSDPHLAAIGFTFGPIPSLLLVPLLPLAQIWPELAVRNLFGTLESALFMAGAVAFCSHTLRAMTVARPTRLLLVLLFALNPATLVWSSNGMSEAAAFFFLMVGSAALARWLAVADSGPRDLLVASLGFAGAYLVRFEALAAGLALLILVPAVAMFRVPGPLAVRRRHALTDFLLVALPFLSVVAVWAVTTKIIIGTWVGYLADTYGQLSDATGSLEGSEEALRIGGTGLDVRAEYLFEQVQGLAPLLVALLVFVLVLAAVRRDWRPLVGLVGMGSVSVAAATAALAGASSELLRYESTVVPLAVLLAGGIAGARTTSVRGEGVPWTQRLSRGTVALVSGVIAIALVAPGMATSAALVQDRRLATQESRAVAFLRDPVAARPAEGRDVKSYREARQASADIDAMRLPQASILTDASTTAAVLAMSQRRGSYLTTSDRTFERAIADPNRFGVQYLLLPVSAQSRFDAVSARFPGLGPDGQPNVATVVQRWGGDGGVVLYELDPSVEATTN